MQAQILKAFPDAEIVSHTKYDWSTIWFKGETHQVTLEYKDQPIAANDYRRLELEQVTLEDPIMGIICIEYVDVGESVFITLEIVTLTDG